MGASEAKRRDADVHEGERVSYKFGWDITPEIKALEEERIELMKKLERSRRVAEILTGVAFLLLLISMNAPLIVRLMKL